MIRIIFIITGLSTGGAEKMLLKLLERLDRERFEPYVISLTSRGELGACVESLNIPLFSLGFKPGLPSLIKFLKLTYLIWRICPNMVQTWMYHADLLGGIAARLAGVRTVVWCIRNSDLDNHKTKLATQITVNVSAKLSKYIPSAILSCSERAGQVHVKIGYAAEKIHIIPNGFDLDKFKPNDQARSYLRKELALNENTLLVGMFGRFDPQKNHKGFFDAAALIHHKMPDVHFVLAGYAIDKKNKIITGYADQHGLLSNTHLLGLRDDMNKLMAAIDLLVLSSSYGEAFPNVLGEAMASGVPCVATDIGDSAWILAETGWVVEHSDAGALANLSLKALQLNCKDRRKLGDLARKRIAEYFEINQIVKSYEDFYESLALVLSKEAQLN
jgi:glycosyltransferase involved in cell wall biosynthesis